MNTPTKLPTVKLQLPNALFEWVEDYASRNAVNRAEAIRYILTQARERDTQRAAA
jgi:hypothetical protein